MEVGMERALERARSYYNGADAALKGHGLGRDEAAALRDIRDHIGKLENQVRAVRMEVDAATKAQLLSGVDPLRLLVLAKCREHCGNVRVCQGLLAEILAWCELREGGARQGAPGLSSIAPSKRSLRAGGEPSGPRPGVLLHPGSSPSKVAGHKPSSPYKGSPSKAAAPRRASMPDAEQQLPLDQQQSSLARIRTGATPSQQQQRGEAEAEPGVWQRGQQLPPAGGSSGGGSSRHFFLRLDGQDAPITRYSHGRDDTDGGSLAAAAVMSEYVTPPRLPPVSAALTPLCRQHTPAQRAPVAAGGTPYSAGRHTHGGAPRSSLTSSQDVARALRSSRVFDAAYLSSNASRVHIMHDAVARKHGAEARLVDVPTVPPSLAVAKRRPWWARAGRWLLGSALLSAAAAGAAVGVSQALQDSSSSEQGEGAQQGAKHGWLRALARVGGSKARGQQAASQPQLPFAPVGQAPSAAEAWG